MRSSLQRASHPPTLPPPRPRIRVCRTPAFQKCGLAQVGWRKLLGAPAPAGKPGPGFTPLPEGGSVRDLVAAHAKAEAAFQGYARRVATAKP